MKLGKEIFAFYCCTIFLMNPASALGCNADLLLQVGVSLPRPLPFIKQDQNGKCGAATAAIAAGYFGKMPAANPYNPYELSNLMTLWLHQTNYALLGLAAPSSLTLMDLANTNTQAALTTTLGWLGLATANGNAGIHDIALGVAAGQVMMVHWTMGTSALEGHWSAVQAINRREIILRDPWPGSPDENHIDLNQFYYRALVAPGVFHAIRVSPRGY